MITLKNKPLAIIGEGSNNFIKNGLSEKGFNVLILPADSRLAPQVSSHADMLLLKIDNTVFCNKYYYENNKSIFEVISSYGYKITPLNFEVSSKYPNDVALNQAVIGRYILGRKESCAKEVLAYAEQHKYAYCSIKQGYAKCSTLIINEKAIISADKGIIDLAESLGINALKIDNGVNEITLDGYDYGFIGGASALYESNVFFFGSLSLHTQANKISDFCKSNGVFPISLGESPLCDVGGAIILPYLNEK